MKSRLVIINDSEIVRIGLQAVLESIDNPCVVDTYDDIGAMLESLDKVEPAIVILGGEWRDTAVRGTCHKIRNLNPRARILILSGSSCQDALYGMIVAGVSGCLTTDAGAEEVVRSIQIVMEDGLYFRQEAVAGLLKQLRDSCSEIPPMSLDGLSSRENEILNMVVRGFSNDEIGNSLNLSKFTVRNNICEMRSKLNLNSRLELAVFAVQQANQDHSA